MPAKLDGCSLSSSTRRMAMTTLNPATTMLVSMSEGTPFNQAQMAAAAFLARYSGRTLETYRYDLRTFFQWCADIHLEGLQAKRAHIESGGRRWRIGVWRRRPSTADSQRSVGSIASPT